MSNEKTGQIIAKRVGEAALDGAVGWFKEHKEFMPLSPEALHSSINRQVEANFQTALDAGVDAMEHGNHDPDSVFYGEIARTGAEAARECAVPIQVFVYSGDQPAHA